MSESFTHLVWRKMMKNKNLFRNMFDLMVEGRARSVQVEIDQYRKILRQNTKV